MPAGRPKGHAKSGGRPKGSPNKATKELKEIIRGKDMARVVDAQYESAVGLFMEADIDTGIEGIAENGERVRVYRKAPSERAADLLFAHGYGRPAQRVEGGDTPIRFEVRVSDVADEE